MKSRSKSLIAIIIACMGLQMSQATALEGRTVLPADFTPLKIIMANDEQTLLVGYTGKPMQSVPTLLQMTENGAADSFSEALEDNVYFHAAALSPTKCIALRYDEQHTNVVAVVIEQGMIMKEINDLGQANCVFPVSDGYAFTTRPSTGNGFIEKRNVDGLLLWRKELPRMTMVYDLIEEKEALYLIGSYQKDREEYATGTVLKLDSEGNMLWQYSSEEESDYMQGFLLDGQDEIAVVGKSYPDDRQGVITAITIGRIKAGECIWQQANKAFWGDIPADSEFLCAARVDTSIMIAMQSLSASGSITMLVYDKNGQCVKSWDESITPIHLVANAFMASQNGSTILTVQGYNANNFQESVLMKLQIN